MVRIFIYFIELHSNGKDEIYECRRPEMTVVSIDFETYLPSAIVYFSYSEVLRTHHFIRSEQAATSMANYFLDVFSWVEIFRKIVDKIPIYLKYICSNAKSNMMESIFVLSREFWEKILLLYKEICLQNEISPGIWERMHTPFLFDAKDDWDLV